MNALKWLSSITAALLMAANCTTASAVVTIDGNASVADGYTSLSVQNTSTQFGDGTSGDPINAGGGSEIDQIFAKVEGGRLYVVVAGNLETNFNKLEVFIDSEAGGLQTLDGSILPAGVDGFCCGGAPDGALQRMGGTSTGLGLEKITFDTGFTADHYLTFTHGFETVRPNDPLGKLQFYAATAHYAELNAGAGGISGALGMQLAQRGLPNALRGRVADFDVDGDVDTADLAVLQANFGAGPAATRLQGDTNDGNVDGADFLRWQREAGFDVTTSTLEESPFAPQNSTVDNSNSLLGPALNGTLSQGDLIDKNYALDALGGGCTDNTGAGCLPKELEFALDVDLINDPLNDFSHRNMDNIVDLQMAFDNSNVDGVNGDGGLAPFYTGGIDPLLEFPAAVTTGIEFSIPLSQIGNPTGTSIKITAFINGGSHDFLANQVSGVGVLQENIGPPGFADFSDSLSFPGDQFVSIAAPAVAGGTAAVPEPTSLALVCLGALVCGCRRRRS